MTPDQAHSRASLLLIGRLVRHRGLTVEEAAAAVAQSRRREAGPHTYLVTLEAVAVLDQTMFPLRALFEALQPLVQAVSDAMAEFARALQPLVHNAVAARTAKSARRSRPAWMSPYGPPIRRR